MCEIKNKDELCCARAIVTMRKYTKRQAGQHNTFENIKKDRRRIRMRTFAPCKAFLFDMFAFFRHSENYFGFRTTNVKEMDHSVSLWWNKRF